MSKNMPVTNGKKLISYLNSIGYRVVRQRGSHVRLEKNTEAGIHKITIPNHDPIAKGTLNDILKKVSIWNQISIDKIIIGIR